MVDNHRIEIIATLDRIGKLVRDIGWIDAALEEGRKVELIIYGEYENLEDPRSITIAGEVLQDAVLKMVKDNEKDEIKLYLDELNSLIKEDKTV